MRNGIVSMLASVLAVSVVIGVRAAEPEGQPPKVKIGEVAHRNERAIADGLKWLARHQLSDGSWSLKEFNARCTDKTCTGQGNFESDTAATAFGLLPMLAAGQTHKSKGPYRNSVSQGLQWLLHQQKPDGNLAAGSGTPMYAHGLATIVLCEAYGMTDDQVLRASAERAIKYIVDAQNKTTGGWRYTPGADGDTCVLGWQIAALTSAKRAKLKIDDAVFQGAGRWLDSVAHDPGKSLYSYVPASAATRTMTASGLLSRQYLGIKRDDPRMTEGVKYLLAELPDVTKGNTYYWYFATQAMHNYGGDSWDTWHRQMRKILIDSQNKDAAACANGSWDPKDDTWGRHGGRLMTTSMSLLILEVYYRYVSLFKT